MAGKGETSGNYKTHEKSYSSFVGLMKWGTIGAFVVAAIVVLVISN